MMKKIPTWILIADGSRARLVFRKSASSDYTQLIDTDFIADNRPSHDIGTERPGRGHDRMGEGRHAMEPPSDPHREGQRALAGRVSDFLEDERKKQAFERLIVIAAPRTLGDLRQSFPSALQSMIIEEIDKDLTMVSLHDLQEKLADLITATH